MIKIETIITLLEILGGKYNKVKSWRRSKTNSYRITLNHKERYKLMFQFLKLNRVEHEFSDGDLLITLPKE